MEEEYKKYEENQRFKSMKKKLIYGLGIGVAGLSILKSVFIAGQMQGAERMNDAYNAFLITQFRDRVTPQQFDFMQETLADVANSADVPFQNPGFLFY
jgi:hypothetical protein